MSDYVSAAAAVRHPPYDDGFPGAAPTQVRAAVLGWLKVAIIVLAAGLMIVQVLSGDYLSALLWPLVVLVALSNIGWSWRPFRGPTIGSDGIDLGRWGVGWDRVSSYQHGWIAFDPPVAIPRGINLRNRLRKTRLASFAGERTQVEQAIRTHQPRLLDG